MDEKTVVIDRDFGRLVRTATQSQIEVKSYYTPQDCKQGDYERDLGNPGEFPYTRGLYPDMYRERLWLKSFIVCYSTPEESNEAFKQYIAGGMTDLRLVADAPTLAGLDPDHPAAWNSMMCGGIATYALNVYEKMLKDLPLENVTYELAHSSISGNIYFYSLLLALMENRGLDPTKLRGNSINDPVRSKLVFGSPDFPTAVAKRICLDHIEYSVRNTPKWRSFSPNGVDPCQAGMDAIRELGGCLAVGKAVLQDLHKQRGISIDEFGPMVFSLDAESDFFETIAKFRAARKMWAKIAKEDLGATTRRAMQLKIGIRTSGLSLQNQKPLNNAARVTLQILSSVLGGVNSVDASSIDEALGLPSYEARIFNLDTQHIIAHEANVPLVADPLGGSYYLEWLTGKIENEVNQYLAEIERKGGIFNCLESGWLNEVMEANRLRVQREEKAEGKRLIVGVSAFQSEEGPINRAIRDVTYKTPSIALREERVAEVKAFKENRDRAHLKRALKNLYRDTKEGKNVSRAVVEVAKGGGTIGEVTGVIRLGHGLSYDPLEYMEMPKVVRQMVEDGE